MLKHALSSKPVTSIPDPELTFIFKANMSKFDVGCILEQENPVTKQCEVIEYARRKYNATKHNVSILGTKLFLVTVWRRLI